jgi:hypothetical protein
MSFTLKLKGKIFNVIENKRDYDTSKKHCHKVCNSHDYFNHNSVTIDSLRVCGNV